MLTSRGLGTVLGDLASLGFDAEWGVLSAADVGANHKRERIWIVAKMANSSLQPISNKSNSRSNLGFVEQQRKRTGNINGSCSKKNVSNTSSIRQQGQRQYEQSINSKKNSQRQANYVESIGRSEFWSIEPPLGRVANGVADRLDRLKAIGNGQVPLCAATAWRLLKERLDGQK